jgi:hypothetical protein
MIVQLHKGFLKAYKNQTNVLEGSTAVVEHKYKNQAARLEITESFIVCGFQAQKTHIKSLAVNINNDRVEITHGRFIDKGSNIDMTRLQSGMSFLQVKSAMTMKEKTGEKCHMPKERKSPTLGWKQCQGQIIPTAS